MTDLRHRRPATRDLQSRHIRVRHGVDHRRAVLLSEMVYGEARS